MIAYLKQILCYILYISKRMSFSTDNSSNLFSINETHSFSSLDTLPSTMKHHKNLLTKKNFKENTRYYYRTFDSSTDDLEEFTYSYKREFDSKTYQFKFIQNGN